MSHSKSRILRQSLVLVFGTCSTLLFTGCSTTGPKFSALTAEPGKAVVYIYRPNRFVGSPQTFSIWVNQKHLTSLTNGGYFAYTTDPGEQHFEYKTEISVFNFGAIALIEKKGDLIDFVAEADRTYYVKYQLTGAPSLKHAIPCKAALVDEGTALQEIAKCKMTESST